MLVQGGEVEWQGVPGRFVVIPSSGRPKELRGGRGVGMGRWNLGVPHRVLVVGSVRGRVAPDVGWDGSEETWSPPGRGVRCHEVKNLGGSDLVG